MLSVLQRNFTNTSFRRITNPNTGETENIMQAVKNTLAENVGGIAQKLAPDDSKFSPEHDVPDQSGKVALVTGGSQGIGYATSFMLLKNNLQKLFILSMDQEVFDGCLKDITEKLGADKAQRVTWIKCDLSDLPSCTTAAKEISNATDRLDILVLNSGRGIMTYQLSEGSQIDLHMMTNHVGHVTLASHLLPLLKSTSEKGTVRIQVQSSNAHEMSPKDTKFESIDELNQDLGPNPQYGRSKLAGLLYARYLDRHLHKSHPNILINATHPGFVETKMSTQDIHEPYPVGGVAMSVGMKPLKKDQWEGAASTLYAATKTDRSGEYICPPAIVEPGSELSRNPELGEQLMKLTREIVKTKFGAQSVDKGCPLKDY
ncbi:hypothetical protein OHC33_001369 [Knufia fluminis]|uniref:Retinol dehydrogenase 12 n=2 Tax=Knufia TaxID=430999 RepID=A0AAN8EVN4_9EURO|nr:hypothetical protein OHC33_001369 [Knufia fluminis]